MARSLGLARNRLRRGLGTGGGSAPYNPAAATALMRAFWRLDQYTANGADVESITDQTGVGNTLSDGGTANRRPLYVASASGGKPGAQFSGGTEWLSNGAFSWGSTVGAYTVWWVGTIDTLTNLDRVWSYGSAPYGRMASGSTVQHFGPGGAAFNASGATTWSGYDLWVCTWDGANIRLYRRTSLLDDDADATAAFADGGVFAMAATTAGGNTAAITLCEMGVARSVISTTELAALSAYAVSYYGLS